MSKGLDESHSPDAQSKTSDELPASKDHLEPVKAAGGIGTPESQNTALGTSATPSVEPKPPSTTLDPQNIFQAVWLLLKPRKIALSFFIGIMIIAIPTFLIWQTLPEETKKEVLNRVTQREDWARLGGLFPAFQVTRHRREVDLTEWEPSVNNVPQDKEVFNDDFIVRRMRPDVTQFAMTMGNSGTRQIISSSTHKCSDRAMENFEQLSWPKMMTQRLIFMDVADEQLDTPFSVKVQTIRFGGFKDSKANWCSIGIWHPTNEFEIAVIFPINKMGHDFKFTHGLFYSNSVPRALNINPNDTIIKGNILTWRIPNPQFGYAYRVDWLW